MKWVAVAAMVAVVAAVAARWADDEPPARPGDGAYRGTEPPGRNLLPVFRLPTYEGRTVSSRALDGRVVVTAFVDTACSEACPIVVAAVAEGLRRLEPKARREVTAVAFSVDPAVDSPRHVRAFLRARHAERELQYAVAPPARMRPVWKAFHVLPAVDTGDADVHSAGVRVFDRSGVWVSTLRAGVDLTAANLVHDIETALE